MSLLVTSSVCSMFPVVLSELVSMALHLTSTCELVNEPELDFIRMP